MEMHLSTPFKEFLEKTWSFGPIGQEVYDRTYSRVKDDGSREEWPDTIRRVVDGNLSFVDPKYHEPGERESLYHLFRYMADVPAGRHLWATGVRSGRRFLSNCFSGSTLVMTEAGPRRIDSLDGPVRVFSQGAVQQTGIGCWTFGRPVVREAVFKSFGEQELYQVTFADGHYVEATADHLWPVTKRANPVKTVDLVGHKVPYSLPSKPERDRGYRKGILHGFVYGDGNLYRYDTASGEQVFSRVSICADKDEALLPIFRGLGYVNITHPRNYKAAVQKLPGDWKLLPFEDASRSYWLGFIVGLLAADGTVDTKGCVLIYQSNLDALEKIAEMARWVGFAVLDPYLQREKNPWTGADAPCYHIMLKRFSVDAEDLVHAHHKENFSKAGEPSIGKSTSVVEVRPTGKTEPVYCCEEPETHRFVLGNGLLTGNCHTSGWDKENPALHFEFLFDHLMQGGGVGSNYSNRYIDLLPPIADNVELHILCSPSHPDYEAVKPYCSTKYSSEAMLADPVEDTREGWVSVLSWILNAAWNDGEPREVFVDVTNLRAKGARLRGVGGVASGPFPLVVMATNVVRIINELGVDHKPVSIDVMNLDHEIARCVVSGNIRRSARIEVKSWLDGDIFDFIEFKNTTKDHWTANVSVEVDDLFFTSLKKRTKRGDHARAVLDAIIDNVMQRGDPGIWNISLSSEDEVDGVFSPNPCGEIALPEFGACNLGHVNLTKFAEYRPNGCMDVYPDLEKAWRLMTRFLIRATFSDFPSDIQRNVVERSRRIGVGFFGYHGFLALHGIKYSESHLDKSVQTFFRKSYEVIRDEARRYAFQLRIPEPIKVTTIAPTGTISKLAGVSEGAHPVYSPYFLLRVRYADNDPYVEKAAKLGYKIEDDLVAPNTKVIEMPMRDGMIDLLEAAGVDPDELLEARDEISVTDYMAVQAMLQREFVDNSIAFTIPVFPETNGINRDKLRTLLRKYLPVLKGTTIMPEQSIPQSPYEKISREDYESYDAKGVGHAVVECKGACPVR